MELKRDDFLKALAALSLLGAVACGGSEPAAAEADTEATTGEEAPMEEPAAEGEAMGEESTGDEMGAEEEAPAEETEGEEAPE